MDGLTTPIPIVALDVPAGAAALSIVDQLEDTCRFYKVGLELFVAEGPRVVDVLRARGVDVFLDLKLHDIPNTVAGAARAAARLDVRLLTVHAAGGPAMLVAARDAVAGSGCDILAVTVLTSIDAPADAVLGLAAVAADAGVHGVVCSGREAAAVRDRFGPRLATLVPGIRPGGVSAHDQARVATPRAAAEAGATYVVLGRAVTGAPDPRAALAAITDELRAGRVAAEAGLHDGRKPA